MRKKIYKAMKEYEHKVDTIMDHSIVNDKQVARIHDRKQKKHYEQYIESFY